jgi:hypothetical protein
MMPLILTSTNRDVQGCLFIHDELVTSEEIYNLYIYGGDNIKMY